MRISDWSSDVCSSDLVTGEVADVAVDEASSGVSTSRGSADLDDLFNSFRKQASGHLVPLFDSRAQGLPRLLMVESSEEHRVGKGGVSRGRSRWSPYN